QVASNSAGYARAVDFDQSPEKTFSYNPSTVDTGNASATQPFLQSQLAAGSGFFNAATPLDLITRSAAAQTKADCYAAFPNLTTAQANSIKEGGTRNAAINQRGNEQLTCLNQWNDYTPSQIRYVQKRQIDKRRSFDLRLDFKVTDELTVYGKGSYQRRRVDDNFLTYGLGGLAVNPASTASPTYSGAASTENTALNKLVPVAGSGYYSYDTPTWRRENYPWANSVVNVNPASVTYDANHHVTGFTIADGNMSTDQIHNIMETSSRYLQLGGNYRKGGLLAEFMVGDAKSDFTRGDKRTTFTYNYGPATLSVLPNGLWTYAFPQGGGPSAATPAQYATLRPASAALTAVKAAGNVFSGAPAYTIAQQPLVTQAPQITWSPKISDTGERTAKLDLTYALPGEVPFLTRLKTGFNFRDTSGNSWGAGGYEAQTAVGEYGKPGYQRAILVPSANVRSSFIGCQDTPGSLGAGGKPCQYGFVPSNSYASNAIQSGQTTLTQAQFQD
ncbi:MAG TPA: TonB-dependent receptor, partial [Pseudoduganella sp.]